MGTNEIAETLASCDLPEAAEVARAVRARERGFSFIEVLVVMGIIAVLVGGVVFIVGKWMQDRPKMLTRQRMSKAQAAAEHMRRKFGTYPATDVKNIDKRWATDMATKIKAPNNATNKGIEAFVQGLYWKGNGLDPGFNDGDFVNSDEDELGKPIGTLPTTELRELKDEWDNPLIYVDARAYGDAVKNGIQVMTVDGDVVRAEPWRNEDGSFQNAGSFQIFSMGPDMEPNTDDDLKHWVDD